MKFQGSLQLERYLSKVIKEDLPRKGQKDPYVANVDGGWDVMKANGDKVKAFGRNGEKAARAYLKKNFRKLKK